MSSPTHLRRAIAVFAAGIASVVAPAAAQAAPVNLATASPFVVLGGSTVTNTGPSVLNGDIGVSPGTAITRGPITVNGVTHANDAVAAQAQSDLTTAYDAAAGQSMTADLSGTDLGNRSVNPGAYRYTSSAQLTGPLTLNAHGDPNAQFVFMIASELTTASGSSVLLTEGASPCNVFWQVGSSATIGSGTAFQGNLLALTSITLNTGATVLGRLLARNGAVTLDTNVIDGSMCGTSTTPPPPTPTPPTPTPPPTSDTTGQAPPASQTTVSTRNGTVVWTRTPRKSGASGPACAAGFTATLRGHQIKSVLFRLDGRRVASLTKSPFRVSVTAGAGKHSVTARVTFKDATPAKTLKLPYRACAAAALRPGQGPSQFTG